MATRLYWHSATNATTGLPTTEQSTQTIVAGGASQSTNRSMTTTIGTTQATITFSATTLGIAYFGRWVSDTIGQTSIAANTWTITYGYADSALADANIAINLYVWRPTTTTKIGTVFDSTIALVGVSNTELGFKATFSGSAIASGISAGTDVLCLEFMVDAGSPVSKTLYYDGTTVITTNATSTSSAASYIETPETISLGTAPGITATPTSKTVTNKFIAHG